MLLHSCIDTCVLYHYAILKCYADSGDPVQIGGLKLFDVLVSHSFEDRSSTPVEFIVRHALPFRLLFVRQLYTTLHCSCWNSSLVLTVFHLALCSQARPDQLNQVLLKKPSIQNKKQDEDRCKKRRYAMWEVGRVRFAISRCPISHENQMHLFYHYIRIAVFWLYAY